MLHFDHLVVSCERLEQGMDYVEAHLGLRPALGGQHTFMGTHNALLRLGDSTYLEVIAIDPSLPDPPQPRWFGLDDFTGAPRLTNWMVRTDEMEPALAQAPEGIGAVRQGIRGDLRWQIAVPEMGQYPFDGACPGLLSWQSPHPVSNMTDQGADFVSLVVETPDAAALSGWLAPLEPAVQIVPATTKHLSAQIETPSGLRVLK